MSVENAVKFLEEVYQDEAKRSEVAGSKSADDIIAYAADKGYEFSVEELQEGQEQFMDQHDDIELSEEDLEDAAGGVIVATFVKAAA